MKRLILSVALILSAFVAMAASLSVVEFVPPISGQATNISTFYQTNANGQIFTNTVTSVTPVRTVLTNTQVRTFDVKLPPGQDVGVTAAFRGTNAASVTNSATFWLQSNYDTNYASLWITNLTFTLAASGTNLVAIGTNASFADRGYTRITVSNGIGSPLTNLAIKLHNLNP